MTANPQGSFALPADTPAWGAVVLAVLLLLTPRLHSIVSRRLPTFTRGFELEDGNRSRNWIVLFAVSAALLSAGYVAYYLRGGPRVIDATSYLLEARGIASGHFAFPVPTSSGSFRGRFLLAPGAESLAVIFPPGFPMLLAPAVALGVPMLLGPCIAAALVVMTYALALRVSASRPVAVLASGLSVVCAALRYHTADTMSHGLCALLLTTLLWTAFGTGRRSAVLAGFACGWLVATRPVSGVVGGLLLIWVLRRSAPRLLLAGAALVPGLALLALQQHAATGAWFEWSQLRYYALADGPPGCFDYGFGATRGCRFEHADFVARYLPEGYGWRAALGTTWRRLVLHSMDIANFEPLSALVLLGAVRSRHLEKFRVLALGTVLTILGYAGFYFDGNYPGGGARFFSDILPLEHVLVAYAASHLPGRRWLMPSALLGFAMHANFSHAALRDREGGRPMFEASVVKRAGVTRGLIYVETDHGFNLGYDPRARDAQRGLVIARYTGDAQDEALFRNLGRPPAYRYHFDPFGGASTPWLEPFEPPLATRFEAEAQWPPREVSGGWVELQRRANACGAQGLELHTTTGRELETVLDLTPPVAGSYTVTVAWAAGPGAKLTLRRGAAEWNALATSGSTDTPTCQRLRSSPLQLQPSQEQFELSTSHAGVILDSLELTPFPTAPGGI